MSKWVAFHPPRWSPGDTGSAIGANGREEIWAAERGAPLVALVGEVVELGEEPFGFLESLLGTGGFFVGVWTPPKGEL